MHQLRRWIFHPGALRFPSRNTKIALQPKSESDSTGRRSHSTNLTIDLGDCIGLKEHDKSDLWCSSGFANTDLDLQLKKHGIHQLIVIGLIAHTCIEATVRFAAELGYEVTVVKDATADYSDAEMDAALDITIPNYASAIVTTKEAVESISSL